MKVEVDARGLECPKPVIQTKKALEKLKEGSILTVVDNEIAKENVSKLAKSMKLHYNVSQKEGFYYIDIFKGEEMGPELLGDEKPVLNDLVIMFGKDTLGEGSEELGDVLVRGYFYTLTEVEPYPKALLFLNSGVNLTVTDSPVIEHLRVLESKGVEILSCGTCLDYFNLKDKLGVGGVTNMYTIVETMNKAKNTISL
ncbi:sulfurtransferase-like selenium metabolism protein YedF [Fusibacter sp. JL216-2]|uniref:sulfurtransferase-like selenium metabolism protein YedF n=1 Tax=Fusibacter sp. JL216-2 TaxID=3071453 RepID=UPI003D359227